MKSYNQALFLTVLFVASQFLVACDGADVRKHKYLEKGKAYIQEKNYDKAKVELKNVIQIDPKYAEAYYLLGMVAETEQSWQQAFGLYSKAADLDKNHLEARARLGRFYLLQGKNDKAREIMDEVLTKAPINASGRLLKASILYKEGNPQAAIKESQALVDENPQDKEAVMFLAAAYIGQDKLSNAIELLNNSIDKNKDNVSLRMLLAQIYAKNNQLDKAEQQLEKIVVLEPGILSHRVTLASFYFNSKQFDKAELTLRDAIKAEPDDAVRYLHLAEFLVNKKGNEAAEKELLSAVKDRPELTELRFGLAKVYLGMDQNDKAIQVYMDVVDKRGVEPDGLKARNKLSVLLLQQNKTQQAMIYIEEILKENPRDNDALITKGKVALIGRDAQTAISSFRTVLRDQPGLSNVSIFLADAHLLNSEPELAKETLVKAIEINKKDQRIRLALAKLMVLSHDYDNALSTVNEILVASKNDLEALKFKTEVQLTKNDPVAAMKTLKILKEVYPDDPFVEQKTGQIYLSQKKFKEAVQQLDIAFAKNPENITTLTLFTKANVATGDSDKAIARLQGALKKQPENASVHQLMAEVYTHLKKYTEAEKSFLRAKEFKPKWDAPYTSLAALELKRGDKRAALTQYEKGLEQSPESLELRIRLASSHESFKEFDKAIELYESILQSHPDNVIALNNLAAILVDHRTDKPSMERAKELALKLTDSQQPAVMDTLGWVYYKTGDHKNALRVLRRVVEKSPDVGVFHYHLGMAYFKDGDTASARTHLKIALDSKSDFSEKGMAKQTLEKLP